ALAAAAEVAPGGGRGAGHRGRDPPRGRRSDLRIRCCVRLCGRQPRRRWDSVVGREPAVSGVGLRGAGGRPARAAWSDVRPAVGRPVRPDAVHRRHGGTAGARVRSGHGAPAHGGGCNGRADPGAGERRGRPSGRSPGRTRRIPGRRPMSAERPEGWQRLHPLSPVVRGGRATIAIAILLLPIAFGVDKLSNATPQLVITGLLVLGGLVSWIVTRWRIEDDDLRIETGLLRRQSLRFPLAQVQAIDVVRPGLARLFRVAELRLRMAGASGGTARLAYVAEHEVEPLRDQLLALARGARHEEAALAPVASGPETAPQGEHVLAVVPTGPLVASILLENWWIVAIFVGLIVTLVVSPHTVTGAL